MISTLFRLFARLLGNQSGNVYVIGAAAVFPLLAMVGGAVDLSRASMAKSQLQAACDAGVLAGRRALARTGTWGTSEQGKANKMFNVNYQPSRFDATGTVFTPTRNSEDDILGTAVTTVPTLMMHIFNYANFELRATCMAELQIANTDVMFVLDTTGSMSGSRISALRQAVKDFHSTLATATSDPGTRVRYGFVPYSTAVNASHLISNADMPSSYIANTGIYQSRQAEFTTPETITSGSGTTTYGPNETNPNTLWNYQCDSWAINGGASTTSGNPPVTTTYEKVSFTQTGVFIWPYGICVRRPVYSTQVTKTIYRFTRWIYGQVDMNTAGRSGLGAVSYATGVSKASSWVDTAGTYDMRELALMNDGERGGNIPTVSTPWDGCLVERATVQDNTWDPIPDGAQDLDVISAPDVNIPGSFWSSSWNELTYYRNALGSVDTTEENGLGNYWGQPGDIQDANDGNKNPYIRDSRDNYACPAPMRAFNEISMTSTSVPSWLNTYLNNLNTDGFTYHDIGMTWAVRLGSPRGMFSANVNDKPNVSTTRHLIFMTDGELNANYLANTAYGLEIYENRVAPSGTDDGDLELRHHRRFEAACRLAKNEGYTVWVIAFGTSITQRLKDCSSGNRWYYASNAAELSVQYAAIASQIADLRIGS